MSTASVAADGAAEAAQPPHTPATWQVEVFYDGACPLCMREIAMLMRRDRTHQRIRFTDISAAEFSAASYGKPRRAFIDRIQGRLPDGTWIEGVEVFRRLYSAVGFAWLIPLTRLPIIRHLLDAAYRVFARNRLKWTGRCDDGACELPTASRQ
ncbi:MAG: DUF393 domain-containing protein [Haliangiales bacterium]